jgi:hypothetical protein
VKEYYYGLFALVQALCVHPGREPHKTEPLAYLQSQTKDVSPLDWFWAEASAGDPTDGVARKIVNDQHQDGYWRGYDVDPRMFPFETAQAILMLSRTFYEPGAPIAVARVSGTPKAGTAVVLDGRDSWHQTAGRTIREWWWDCDGDGKYEVSGPTVKKVWNAPGQHRAKLRVTDSEGRTSDTVVYVTIPKNG